MVVVSGGRVQKVTYPSFTIATAPISDMTARAVLICRPNSHHFQERTLVLDTPAKVGRSVARARAASNNAIFDCKVLSRHHALLWYENGKFYLQDTKSSNGTFVNNNRLSDGGKESAPREVCSGDIVQFGVDVLENNRKVTHGCVIATLKLYLPDGKEAKASQSVGAGLPGDGAPGEVYKLAQYLQDAMRREQQLEVKLGALQRLVEQARQAAELGWKAAVEEDRLLSRVDVLESKLRAYSKTCGDDGLRDELARLQEDKSAYQVAAKDSLQRLHRERLEALGRVAALEQTVQSSEDDRLVAEQQLQLAHDELRELAQQLASSQSTAAMLADKLRETESAEEELRNEISELLGRERILSWLGVPPSVNNIADAEDQAAALRVELTRAAEELAASEKKLDSAKQQIIVPKTLTLDEDSSDTEKSEENSIIENVESNEIKNNKTQEQQRRIEELQNDFALKSLTFRRIQERIEYLEKTQISQANAEEKCKIHESAINEMKAMLTALENKLREETDSKTSVVSENEQLRRQLTDTQKLHKEVEEETIKLKDQIASLLSELETRPTESYLAEQRKTTERLEEALKLAETEKAELQRQSGETSRLSELEDELVLVKERYAQCLSDATVTAQELQTTKAQAQALAQRSHAVLFCYVAPLLLIIAYLLVSPALS